MAKIVPVAHDFGWIGGEDLRKLLLVRKLLELLPDLKTKPHLVFPRQGDEWIEASLDPGPDFFEIVLSLPHRLYLDLGIFAVKKTSVAIKETSTCA